MFGEGGGGAKIKIKNNSWKMLREACLLLLLRGWGRGRGGASDDEAAGSQALLGQGGGHLVGQRAELRGLGDVEAPGGRHGAQLTRRILQGDDLRPVVGARLRRLTEVQFMGLNKCPQSL